MKYFLNLQHRLLPGEDQLALVLTVSSVGGAGEGMSVLPVPAWTHLLAGQHPALGQVDELQAPALQACSQEPAAWRDGECIDGVLEDERSGLATVCGEDDETVVYGRDDLLPSGGRRHCGEAGDLATGLHCGQGHHLYRQQSGEKSIIDDFYQYLERFGVFLTS